MKKHRIAAVMLASLLLAAAFTLAGCGGSGAEKDEGYRTETGWAVTEDGSDYTYVAVIENTTEDKVISGRVSTDGLDPDGNVIPKKDEYDGVYYPLGPIWPGRKGVYVVPYSSDGMEEMREWDTVPSGFDIKANVVQRTPVDASGTEDLEKEAPDIEVVSAEEVDSEEIFLDAEAAKYRITLRNNGRYDCEADFSGGKEAIPALAVVYRNEDGGITGGVTAAITMEGDTLLLPAGEETVIEAFTFDMPPGEPEFCFVWQ